VRHRTWPWASILSDVVRTVSSAVGTQWNRRSAALSTTSLRPGSIQNDEAVLGRGIRCHLANVDRLNGTDGASPSACRVPLYDVCTTLCATCNAQSTTRSAVAVRRRTATHSCRSVLSLRQRRMPHAASSITLLLSHGTRFCVAMRYLGSGVKEERSPFTVPAHLGAAVMVERV
jgi:hypothetical protein